MMKKNKLPLDILCKDIPYDLKYLRNEKEHVEWDVFCQIMSNIRSAYTEDDLFYLGTKAIHRQVFPVVSAMVGFFLSTKEMYRLISDPRKGLGTQVFRCITTTTRDIDKYHLELLLELPAGYQYCDVFFIVTHGFFSAVPKALKHKPAKVIMHKTERGALYKISLPYQLGAITWLKQFFSLPSSKMEVIREINETNALLYDRYSQLEESQAKIQKQAKQLETAHSVSQLIRSDLDLDSTLGAVAESLITVAGFAAVEINVYSVIEREPVQRMVRLGDMPPMVIPLKRILEGHGKSIGEINLWLHPGSSIDDAKHLLDYIIPTITMEILNALSFKLVDDYRSKLEGKVDEIQSAIIDERRRISGEIHDDLGTNLSAIALMSGVMKENVSGSNVEKIAIAAQQSLEKIGEIVWSLNPKNDKLENLVAYIRKYAVEYFELTPIKCKVNIQGEIPDTIMNSEQRRNIFLSVKEALHNVLKHSDASSVVLSFLKKESHGEIIIHDNGKGITSEVNRFGNGLQSMEQRMQSVGGYFEIENMKGTIIRLGYDLT